MLGLTACSVGGESSSYGGFPGLTSLGGGDEDGDDGETEDDEDDGDDDDADGDETGGGTGGEETSGDGGTTTGVTTAGSTTHITVGPDDDDAGDDDDGPIWDLGQLPDVEPPAEDCGDDVDVVFVMDVSTSMGPFLSTLADEILAVDAVLQGFNLPSDARYGLVVFVDDYLVLGGGAAYPSANALRNDFIAWSNFTASNEQIGGGNQNITWPENSMDGLWAASQLFAWRPAATTTRIIIHTTDDTFWNGPTVGNGVGISQSYNSTVNALQNQEIRVYSFAADIGGQCECLDVSMGWFGPFQGQPSLGDATNGGVYDIDQVLSGAISLSQAIPEAVSESICEPYF